MAWVIRGRYAVVWSKENINTATKDNDFPYLKGMSIIFLQVPLPHPRQRLPSNAKRGATWTRVCLSLKVAADLLVQILDQTSQHQSCPTVLSRLSVRRKFVLSGYPVFLVDIRPVLKVMPRISACPISAAAPSPAVRVVVQWVISPLCSGLLVAALFGLLRTFVLRSQHSFIRAFYVSHPELRSVLVATV